MKVHFTALLGLSLLISGCSTFEREPGPAERIGRALDEMRKGIDELAPEETPEERRAREDREWQRRQDDYYRRQRSNTVHGSQRDSEEDFDLYRDSDERERAERDREFWENDPKEKSRDSDRY
jgi:hypothetical protein